jgi:internalin A
MSKYSGFSIALIVSLLCIGCFKENPWESTTDTASDTDSQTGSETATDTGTSSASDTSSATATPTDTGSGADSTGSGDTTTSMDTGTGTNTDSLSDTTVSSDSDRLPAVLTIAVVTGMGDAVIGTFVDAVYAVSNTIEQSVARNVSFAISPGNTAFSIVDTTCDMPLNPGDSCNFTVRFEPMARGLNGAAVLVQYHNGVSSASEAVPVTGTGLDAARLTASVETHNFGTVFMYEKADATLTITNNALDSSATGMELTVDNDDFSLAHDCATLTPGDACDVDITFSPSLLAEINGTLTVRYNNGATTASTTIELRGDGADRCAGPIEFPDANLEAAIRDELGLGASASIYSTDLDEVTAFSASNRHISDLRGIQCLVNVTNLDLTDNVFQEVFPLSTLSNLIYLELDYNDALTDISPLASLVSLEVLVLSYTNVTDLSPLASATSLTSITIFSSGVSDLSSLASLTNLTSIIFVGNEIVDVSSLELLTKLTYVNLAGNKIADISPLASLTNLKTLYVTTNNIVDISPLTNNAGLGSGDTVDIKSNPIDCTSPDMQAAIEELLNRGVDLTHDCN